MPLQIVSSYKYLGVTVDCQLNYNLHVNKIVATVSGKLKQFQRMRGFLNGKAALFVYKSMLLPILEYGDIFLSSTTVKNRKKLQVLQNKGLRCALNKGMESSTDELHAEATLLRLKYRREQHMYNFMFDAAMDSVNLVSRSQGSVLTRSRAKRTLKVNRPKTERFKKSLAYKGPTEWNALPADLHQVEEKAAFKKAVGNWVVLKAIKVADGSAQMGQLK